MASEKCEDPKEERGKQKERETLIIKKTRRKKAMKQGERVGAEQEIKGKTMHINNEVRINKSAKRRSKKHRKNLRNAEESMGAQRRDLEG